MTARSYNFTKQNGTLYKAGKRFTKQSGVKKRILAGWTKRNGVVEQVYKDPSKGFYYIASIPNVDGYAPREVYAIDEEKIYFDTNSYLCVLTNYDSAGPVTNLSTQYEYAISGYYNWNSFNYANGVANSQSIFGGVKTNSYAEMLLSAPTSPSGARMSTRTYSLRAPVKSSTVNEFYGYYVNVGDISLYRVAATGSQYLKTTVATSERAFDSSGLIVRNGVGYYAVALTSTTTYTRDTSEIAIFKCENGSTTKISVDTINTGSKAGIWSFSRIYTIDGTEIYFSYQTPQANIHSYGYFCKCDSQGAVTKVQVGRNRRMIGTYGGYIYVVAADDDVDNLCVIEKYNTSFQLIDTHAIPAQTGINKITNSNFPTVGVITSNSRYCGFLVESANDNKCLVLDLAQF